MNAKVVFPIIIVLAGILMGCAKNPANPLIEYQRSGGIAGFDDRLVIEGTGKATLTRQDEEVSFMVSADEIKAIEDALAAVKFSQLDEEYLPGQPGADLFDYWLTYDGHAVRMVDTAVPDGMLPVLDMLNQLIEANS